MTLAANRKPATLAAATAALIDAAGGLAKAAEWPGVRLSRSQLQRCASPAHPEVQLPVDVVMALESVCDVQPGPVSAHMVAAHGWVLIEPQSPIYDGARDLMVAAGRLAQEQAAAWATLAEALVDEIITPGEACQCIASIDVAMSRSARVRQMLELERDGQVRLAG